LGLFGKHVVAYLHGTLNPGTSQHISKFLGNMGVISFTKLSVVPGYMYVYEEYVSHGTKIYSIFYNNKFDSMEHLFYT